MSRSIDDATVLAANADIVRPVVLVEIITPSLDIRMCSLMQDIDFNGNTYTYGSLGNIGTINESDDITESSCTLTFGAIDSATVAAIAASDFINSPVSIRIMFCDEEWQPVGDGVIYFEGSAASQNIALGETAEITVNCKSKIASLNRPRSIRYSDQEQQAKYPGDLGMQYATTVSNANVRWPAAEWFENQ